MRSDVGVNRNVRTRQYKERLSHLPERIQQAAQEAFEAFKRDPFDPTLNNHQLTDTKKGQHRNGSRSVSVTRRYRAIYVEDDGDNVWYWIGSHEDYNNFVGK